MRFFIFLMCVFSLVSCSKDVVNDLETRNDYSMNIDGLETVEIQCEIECIYDGYPLSEPANDDCNLNPVVGELDFDNNRFEICFDAEIISTGDPFVILGETVHYWDIAGKKISEDRRCMRYDLGPGKNLGYTDLLNFGFMINVNILGPCPPVISDPGGNLNSVVCIEDCHYDSYLSQYTGVILNDCNLNPIVKTFDELSAEFSICFDSQIKDASYPYYDEGDQEPGLDEALYWEYYSKELSQNGRCMIYRMNPEHYEIMIDTGYLIDVKKVIDCGSDNPIGSNPGDVIVLN